MLGGKPSVLRADALVSGLRSGHELAFLDGDAHKDLVTGANVPVSSPGWLTPPAREAR